MPPRSTSSGSRSGAPHGDPQLVANGSFGSALAASGSRLLVTAPSMDTPTNERVRVFERKALQLSWPP